MSRPSIRTELTVLSAAQVRKLLTMADCIGALACMRRLQDVRVWGRTRERAQAFAQREAAACGIAVAPAASVREAVAGADIVEV